MNRIPIIIDTDIGGDIDDAFAICLAMQCPEIELLGVTTVFKNTVCRALIAKKLLRYGGFGHIPVAAGASVPLSNFELFGRSIDFEEAPETWKESYSGEELENVSGADLIIRILTESAEPVTIVTLGALTNIADVLRRRPDLKRKIRQLNVMGGAYFINWTEFNFVCDPEAADMVLNSGIVIKAAGIDVTLKCMVSAEQMDRLKMVTHPCIGMLLEMCGKWSQSGMVCLHDPLALWTVFDESVVTWERQLFRVECRAEYARGVCVKLSDHNWKRAPEEGNLYVAASVDAGRFMEQCIGRLLEFGREEGKAYGEEKKK